MKIAILGSGHVGGTLGRRWAEAGHQVVFGSRDPTSDKLTKLKEQISGNVEFVDIPSAAQAAEFVILAVPWLAAEATITAAGELLGKVLVDCINPLNAQFDGLDLGFQESASERIAQWASGAKVVKAFNTVSAATIADPSYGEHQATMFYCGDDDQAKETVHRLSEQLGLQPVDSGPLVIARYLEPLAMLYIHLAIKKGWGSNCAFKIVRR